MGVFSFNVDVNDLLKSVSRAIKERNREYSGVEYMNTYLKSKMNFRNEALKFDDWECVWNFSLMKKQLCAQTVLVILLSALCYLINLYSQNNLLIQRFMPLPILVIVFGFNYMYVRGCYMRVSDSFYDMTGYTEFREIYSRSDKIIWVCNVWCGICTYVFMVFVTIDMLAKLLTCGIVNAFLPFVFIAFAAISGRKKLCTYNFVKGKSSFLIKFKSLEELEIHYENNDELLFVEEDYFVVISAGKTMNPFKSEDIDCIEIVQSNGTLEAYKFCKEKGWYKVNDINEKSE